MQVTDELIRSVVQEVLLAHAERPRFRCTARPREAGACSKTSTMPLPPPPKRRRKFETRGLDDRRKAVDCIRRICIDQAETLGREELDETRIGRLEHKVEKLTSSPARKRLASSSCAPKPISGETA